MKQIFYLASVRFRFRFRLEFLLLVGSEQTELKTKKYKRRASDKVNQGERQLRRHFHINIINELLKRFHECACVRVCVPELVGAVRS